MGNENNEPQSQQEARNRADQDRNKGHQPADTSTWDNATGQNYLNQYHGNTNQSK